jgi:hypothetical protein
MSRDLFLLNKDEKSFVQRSKTMRVYLVILLVMMTLIQHHIQGNGSKYKIRFL